MADTKISALPASTTPLAGTEVLPIVQSSATKQVSVANLTVGRSVSVADLTVATNNVVFSTAAKGANFTANTPATGMTSQLLNWYEEGTWTPEYDAFAGAFTTLTYTTQQGTYVRIGRTVICQFNIVVNLVVVGTAATLLLLKGFPFAFNNGALAAGRVGGFINFYTGWTNNAPTMVNWAGYTDKLGLLYSGATTISNTPPVNLTSGCEFHGCVIYQI